MAAYDAVILGAGAAGLMCALTAGGRGRRVLLLDHAERAGAKILISGGGRCNFTNLGTAPERFLSANPHFCRSALARYTARDFIALVERHRIAYHEKTLGQLFCDGSARQIVAMLLAECAGAGVELRLGCTIGAVGSTDGCFRVTTDAGTMTAPALVLATGGPSIPKMGASGLAYRLARQFGLGMIEPRPALVPLILAEPDRSLCRLLAGVAVPAQVACGRQRFRESLLFTHRGLSGPAILQISSYWRQGETVTVDLLPDHDAAALLKARKQERPKAEAKTVLAEVLPARLAETLAQTAGLSGPLGGLSDRALAALAARVKSWQIIPEGSEGWAKAEVTAGGIDTAGLSSRTMAAKAAPGLYAIGEAVDVTGWLGGYNFQWAWSSGWCAGQAL